MENDNKMMDEDIEIIDENSPIEADSKLQETTEMIINEELMKSSDGQQIETYVYDNLVIPIPYNIEYKEDTKS